MIRKYATPQAACNLFLLLSLITALTLSAPKAWGQAITAVAFGMQCGQDTAESDCAAVGTPPVITLPTEPGTLRLWDSEVQWNDLNYAPASGCTSPPCMNFELLDAYLNAIASPDSNVSAVIYTFGDTPCWDVSGCGSNNDAEPNAPSDLTGLSNGGSSTFNAFVKALVTHCTTVTPPAIPNCVGNCPTGQSCNGNLIQYFELWNEANSSSYWIPPNTTYTSQQWLYALVEPVISTITTYDTGAKFLTPSTNYGVGNQESWMDSWVQQEETSGLISNVYNFHLYIEGGSAADITPEARYCLIPGYPPTSLCGSSPASGVLYPNYYPPAGYTYSWKALPWVDSETNFNASTYACPSADFTSADCAGQPIRWQILQMANLATVPSGDSAQGASNVSWYRWKATIGDWASGDGNSTLPTDYYYGEQFLELGNFNNSCTYTSFVESGTTYYDIVCPFLETSGTQAYWVWTDYKGGSTCTVPTYDYADYKSIATGETTTLSGSRSSIACAVQPILLEE
jgi:hypothetical protein